MNYKSTLVMLVLVAALGALFFFGPKGSVEPVVENPQTPGGVDAAANTKPVLDSAAWNLEKIGGVNFHTLRQEMEAEREGEDWVLRKPVRWRMNEHDIPNLINVATGVRYFEKLKDGANLKDLKLDPALATVTLKPKAGGEAVVLEVGRLGVAGAGYLKIAGKPEVYVVSDALHKLVLERNATDWRSQSLAGVPGPERADLVTLVSGGESFKFQRVDGKWVLEGEKGGRLDQDTVNSLVFGVGRAYASKFIEDKPADLARYGLDKPRAVVRLRAPVDVPAQKAGAASQPAAGQPAATQPAQAAQMVGTLSIGSPVDLAAGAYYAMWSTDEYPSTVVFTLSKMSAETFMRGVETYRERRLVNLKHADIMKVESAFNPEGEKTDADAAKENAYKLKLEKDVWQFDDGKSGPGVLDLSGLVEAGKGIVGGGLSPMPDTPAVNALLDKLTRARATGFEGVDYVLTQRSQPDVNLGVIQVSGLGGLETEKLTFYHHDPEHWKVRHNDDSVYQIVAKKDLTGVSITRKQLLDRGLINVIPTQVVKLEIDRTLSAYPAKYVITRVEEEGGKGPQKWVFEDGSAADAAAVSRVLDLVAPLRAVNRDGKVSPKPGSVIRFAVTSKEGQRFEYGVAAGGKDGDTVLFPGNVPAPGTTALPTAPRALMAAMESEVRSRTMLPVSADQLAMVTVNPGTDLITINQGNKGSYRNPDGKVLDPSKVGPMFDALGGLRCERIVEAPKSGLPGEAVRDLVVQTRDGAKWTLKLYRAQGLGNVGVLTGPSGVEGKTSEAKVFTLSEDTMQRLLAEVVAKVRRATEEEEQHNWNNTGE
jgi:hypothetical protein